MGEITRRNFIKKTGTVAALSPLASKIKLKASEKKKDNLDKFDHVVVLMMENRSFDNMLGYLYEPGTEPRRQKFEGVAGKDLSNPIPAYAADADKKSVPVQKGYVMDNPNPDPGEEYPHVNTQLFGTVIPDTNRFEEIAKMKMPFNEPAVIPANPGMNGFLEDYINNFMASEKRMPTYDEYKVIMECFPPEAVPVISTLAKEFAVCDHWHCAVPSQTFCNRSFFNAGTSSGQVVNTPYPKWLTGNNAETIFNRIDSLKEKGLTWKIYFDKQDIFSLTGLIHYQRLKPYYHTNICHMEQFYEDVSSGNLPNYAFVEPRLFFNHNDEHPPASLFGQISPSSVLAGEILINDVYNAIRQSGSQKGSNYQNTLFTITYDEHGGCYDHVPPGPAVPPEPGKPAGEMGFTFDRLGIRVSTIFVSAYVEKGTIINKELQHTSMIKTLSDKWGLGYLTERDRNSPDFTEVFNLDKPRERNEWPVITPRDFPEEQKGKDNLDQPLNWLQKAFMGLVLGAVLDVKYSYSEFSTIRDAINYMMSKKDQAPGCE